MSWNYRVVKQVDKEETWFGIHEVYYDDMSKPKAWTQEPVVVAEDEVELFKMLRLMQESAAKSTLEIVGNKLQEVKK